MERHLRAQCGGLPYRTAGGGRQAASGLPSGGDRPGTSCLCIPPCPKKITELRKVSQQHFSCSSPQVSSHRSIGLVPRLLLPSPAVSSPFRVPPTHQRCAVPSRTPSSRTPAGAHLLASRTALDPATCLNLAPIKGPQGTQRGLHCFRRRRSAAQLLTSLPAVTSTCRLPAVPTMPGYSQKSRYTIVIDRLSE